ncbi:MAG: hypothetical protein ABW002_01390 [Xanthomonas sp.]
MRILSFFRIVPASMMLAFAFRQTRWMGGTGPVIGKGLFLLGRMFCRRCTTPFLCLEPDPVYDPRDGGDVPRPHPRLTSALHSVRLAWKNPDRPNHSRMPAAWHSAILRV